jgi:asparagine synthase (glutamine-hydrolysing)
MCGIAGILYRDASRPVDQAVLKDMGDSIAHRGPDAEGFWSEPGIGLVHRRLSIIDLTGGQQPLGNEDDSVLVVFNGEIYNFQALRGDLESRGHRFRTHSDTEVLVHLYEESGARLVERLRGMFAFALWDRRRRRLLLARDRLGIKPLYIYRDSEKVLFGSELKAILACPGVARNVDEAALEDYLAYGMVSGTRTIFRQTEKLAPAHTLVLGHGEPDAAPCRYWQLRLEPDPKPTAAQWQEAVLAKLDETVRLHLIADVPVGAFLSGGLDSSAVVASAAGSVQGRLQTFSMGFPEESFSELPYARTVAEQYGTRHAEEIATPDAVSLLEEIVHYFDEPFADSSAIPTFLVCRMARRSVKVALSGDGGDEAFGGYARYAHDLKEAAMRRWLPGWFRRAALAPLARVWPKADWLPRPLRAKTLLTNLSLDDASAYANTLALCRPQLRRRILSPHLAASINGHQPEHLVRRPYANAPPGDALGGMIAADVATLLPDDYLVKVDRASMAHGLELRPPLLDHELLELAGRIPSGWKVYKGETKWLFKEAVRERLPASIVRRAKRGFEMPLDAWLRGSLREVFEDVVLKSSTQLDALVDRSAVQALYRSHLRGSGRHGGILWAMLVLARWSERYLSARVPPGQMLAPVGEKQDRCKAK